MNFEDIYGLNFRCLAPDFCWQRLVRGVSCDGRMCTMCRLVWWCQYSRTINYGFILFSGNPARDRLVNKLGWSQGY